MALFRPILDSALAHLRASENLAGIPIHAMGVAENAGQHIETLIQAALDQVGTSVEINIVGFAPQSLDAPGPYFSDISLAVRIIQNPEVALTESGAGIPIWDVAEAIMVTGSGLHHYQDPAIGNRVVLLDEEGGAPVADPNFDVLDLNFQITGGLLES